MTETHVYLDYNATTPLRPGVKKILIQSMEDYGNPSSIHKLGRINRSRIENTRDIFSAYFRVPPQQIYFTSGGTEANNAVIRAHPNHAIIMSSIEHESVYRASDKAFHAPVTADGQIDLAHLESMLQNLSGQPILLSIMMANNETGVLQPIQEVVRLAKKHQAVVHCDAVPALTKIPICLEEMGVDYLTISAHKIGGPKGCGAVILNKNIQLPSLLQGGGQEKGQRAGTENLMGIIGFGQALLEAEADDWRHVTILRDLLETIIIQNAPEAVIYGKNAPRLPNTSLMAMPGVEAQKQLIFLDLNGFAVSSGSACSSGKISGSRILKAMGVPEDSCGEAIRVSLGWETSKKQIEGFAKTWLRFYNQNKVGKGL